MTKIHIQLIRYSLAFLWCFTALTSAVLDRETGYELLANIEINDFFANVLLYGGSLLDLTIGIWILAGKYQKQYVLLCCTSTTTCLII